MPLSRRIARPLLASVFIADGVNALRDPAAQLSGDVAGAEPATARTGPGGIDPVVAVRVNGGVQIVAGLLLALGKARRLASVVLMGSLVVSTHAGHRFWEETDETEREQQRLHFVKNVALFGGLILAAVDTEGAPSLGWRAKRRVRTIEGAVAQGLSHTPTPSTVGGALPAVTATAKRRAHDAGVAGRRARRRVRAAAVDAGPAIAAAGEGLKKARSAVTELAQESGAGAAQTSKRAAKKAKRAARQLQPAAEDAANKAGALAQKASQQLSPVVEDAANKAAEAASKAGRQLQPVVEDAANKAGALAQRAARQLQPVAEEAAHKAVHLAATTAQHVSPVAEDAASKAAVLTQKASQQLAPVVDSVANSAAANAASEALAKLSERLPNA